MILLKMVVVIKQFLQLEYFTNRGGNVYFTCLDAVKAFDRVNHYFLLSGMLIIGFPVQFVHIFCDWFRNLKAYFCQQSVISKIFDVKSCVLRDSLIGTQFYNLNMDKIFFCCNRVIQAVVLAVFLLVLLLTLMILILMSASCVKLQAMLKICENFGMLCDLKFNVAKSCAGCVGRSRPAIDFQVFLKTWFYYGLINLSIQILCLIQCVGCKPIVLRGDKNLLLQCH